MRWVVLLLVVVGCGFSAPHGGADASIDTPIDTPVDEVPCTPWETRGGHVTNLCSMPPSGSWKIDTLAATYDTDTRTFSGGNGPQPASYLVTQTAGGNQAVVVSVADFTVDAGASLRVVGQHPLIVLSWSTISVDGAIDGSSQRLFSRPGAGADLTGCSLAQAGQGTDDAGGGGGGGFKVAGARGGDGNVGGMANPGGNGGRSISRPRLFILGGCQGGDGGTGTAAGAGGSGGGAIQLAAQTSITISGTGKIHTGGMGGGGARNGNGGGGGGGSGGFIGLDAPMVTTMPSSVLAANGGGGGAGCMSGIGGDGQDGQPVNMAALGGAATCVVGAIGGAGSARTSQNPGPGALSGSSGGGGGGSVGYIVVWAPAGGFMRMGVQTPVEVLVTDVERP